MIRQFNHSQEFCAGYLRLLTVVHNRCGTAQARQKLSDASIEGGYAVCGVSGGVDSTVAAVLAHQAFGERMTAIYVETGLMREGESVCVQEMFESLGIPLKIVDHSQTILAALKGKQAMREKHQVVFDCLHDEIIRQAKANGRAKRRW